jgi:hypothetical protein
MKTRGVFRWLLPGMCFASIAGAATINLDFDHPISQVPGVGVGVETYDQSGFEFRDPTGTGSLIWNGPGEGQSPQASDGTSTLSVSSQGALELSSLDGSTFSLLSIDLSEYSTVFAVPKVVPIFGDRADGTTVSIEFTTDGVIDGVGGLADFQTFTLPAEFRNLVRVRVPTFAFALDNVIVETPEPRGVATLAAVALAVYGLRRR